MTMHRRFFLALALTACTTSPLLQQVQAYRAARSRGDVAAEQRYLAPDARMWYETKSGLGDPLRAGNSGRYEHWDKFFHSRSELRDWKVDGNAVSATVHEINDFYRLLDWEPVPYRMTWFLNDQSQITGALIQSLPGTPKRRLDEFRAWAKAHHPDELEYLMPNGKIDPTGDRAERWKQMLIEWRAAAGLPSVS